MLNVKELRNLDAETVLGALGVQKKRKGAWVAPAMGGLFLGAVAGVASALLLAPASAEALRAALRGESSAGREFNPLPEVEPA